MQWNGGRLTILVDNIAYYVETFIVWLMLCDYYGDPTDPSSLELARRLFRGMSVPRPLTCPSALFFYFSLTTTEHFFGLSFSICKKNINIPTRYYM